MQGEEGKPTESKTAKQRQPLKGKEKEGSIYTDISDNDYTTGCRFLEKARNDVSTFKVAVTVLDAEIDYLPTLLPSRAILAIKYLNVTAQFFFHCTCFLFQTPDVEFLVQLIDDQQRYQGGCPT